MSHAIQRPKDVGIVAMEVYFPSEYVDQSELEDFDKVSSGKYTIGLGQQKMGFCSDNEDINSICLTAVSNLMGSLLLSYSEVGRLEVGTETIIDKSKSVKTVLMQLFADSGNMDVEGVDSTNACYGGTAAFFNSIAWVESTSWDGRFALVVAADIAVYASGNARCTGGAGAIAMLIGPSAPIVIEDGLRASHMMHVYDFYKPDLSSEYPTVDGKLSITCYLQSLDACYSKYREKKTAKLWSGSRDCKLNELDALVFHSPYCKLVQKSVARLAFVELLQSTSSSDTSTDAFRNLKLEDTYHNKDVEKEFMKRTVDTFKEKVKPSLLLAENVGNMYTASLYSGLASWIPSLELECLVGKRIGMFSYGSGSAATFYILKITSSSTDSLSKIHSSLLKITSRLNSRIKVSPVSFAEKMAARENVYNKPSYVPQTNNDHLFPGTWFLNAVDDQRKRTYSRKVAN